MSMCQFNCQFNRLVDKRTYSSRSIHVAKAVQINSLDSNVCKRLRLGNENQKLDVHSVVGFDTLHWFVVCIESSFIAVNIRCMAHSIKALGLCVQCKKIKQPTEHDNVLENSVD